MRKRHAVGLIVLSGLVFLAGRTTAPEKAPPAQADSRSPAPSKSFRSLQDPAQRQRRDIAHAPRAPLPASDVPLKQVLAELEERAEDGDSEAATRLARDLHRCGLSRRMEELLPIAANHQLGQKVDGATPDTLKQQASEFDALKQALTRQESEKRFCEGLSDQEIDAEEPVMLRAALLGDQDSTACYLQWTSNGISGALDHPEWMVDYKQYAPQLLQASIERGSLTVLDLVAFAEQRAASNLLGQALGYDPAQLYRLKKLRNLTAANQNPPGYSAADLDALAARLDPAAKSAGDAWAQDMYQRYYAGRPAPDPSRPKSACASYAIDD